MTQSNNDAPKPWTCDSTGPKIASNKDNSSSTGAKAPTTEPIITQNIIRPLIIASCDHNTYMNQTQQHRRHVCSMGVLIFPSGLHLYSLQTAVRLTSYLLYSPPLPLTGIDPQVTTVFNLSSLSLSSLYISSRRLSSLVGRVE